MLRQPDVPLVLSKHFNTDHFQTPTIGKCTTIISTGHSAHHIVVDKFAQNPNFGLVRQETEVDTGLGVAFTSEDAAFACAKRDHMAWAGEIGWSGMGGGECTDSQRAVVSGDASCRVWK